MMGSLEKHVQFSELFFFFFFLIEERGSITITDTPRNPRFPAPPLQQ